MLQEARKQHYSGNQVVGIFELNPIFECYSAAEAREQQYSVLQIRCCTIVGDRLTDMNPSPLSFKFNKVARKFSRYWGLLSVCRLHTFLAP